VPVFNVCEGLGLAFDDPRGLTVTGGLPFFGGPGNNYSMHAIAETVQRATYTVVHGRDGARTGIVIGRLEAGGRRFIARGSDADPGLIELLAAAPEPVGERVYVRSSEAGNQVTVS
jgi:Thiolase-like protein type 1 additional C-terminal domain